jgi:hypothetical protein
METVVVVAETARAGDNCANVKHDIVIKKDSTMRVASFIFQSSYVDSLDHKRKSP